MRSRSSPYPILRRFLSAERSQCRGRKIYFAPSPGFAWGAAMTDIERWRDVKGFEGIYWISDFGKIRNRSQLIKPRPTQKGYMRVTLSNGSLKRLGLIHRLVLEAFVGPCPHGMETDHLNGIAGDNRLSNLKWSTRSENNYRKLDHGTLLRGEELKTSKLTAENVRWIKRHYDKTKHEFASRALAKRFNVCPTTIKLIIRKETWAHV